MNSEYSIQTEGLMAHERRPVIQVKNEALFAEQSTYVNVDFATSHDSNKKLSSREKFQLCVLNLAFILSAFNIWERTFAVAGYALIEQRQIVLTANFES